MIQIIKRKDGEKSEITNLDNGRPQISYNDDGHLCLRIIHGADSDTLVVLDRQISSRVLRFLRRNELPF
jgi:hypothetical protein